MSRLRLFPLLLIVAATECRAKTATTTTLSLSAASAAWPSAVTLTATVKAGSSTVTPGLVKFCNAAATSCQGASLFGQAQLTSSGTASIARVFPIGTESINAVFVGTNTHATSTSSASTFTVIGLRASHATIAASANSPYTLTATVTGIGSQALSGNVSFLDNSNANYQVGTAALGAATISSAFQSQTLSPTGSEPTPLVIGDFNSDGYPDFVVGNVNANSSGDSTLTLFLSIANDNYGTPITVNLPGSVSGVSALAVGDFNNDGKLDLAVASGNTNQVTIVLGDGKGDFTVDGAFLTGIDPNSIAVADFNGDGNADLAITNQFSSSVTILLGNGQGDFTQVSSSPGTGSFPYSIAVGDFNGDGKQDLAVPNYYGNDVTILLGNGNGTFTPASSPSTGVYPDWVAVGDFNGDGKQDLAVTNQFSKTVTILLGNGKGDFTPASESPATGNNPDSIAVGDFNGDGVLDLAVANSESNTVTVFFGEGNGTFGTSQTVALPSGTAPFSVAAADFNTDGRLDFVVAGAGNNTAVIDLNLVTSVANAILSGVKVPGGGTHDIYCVYEGNTNYSGIQSLTVALAGAPIATSTAVSIEPAGTVAVGETVQWTANISPALVGALTPTGTVSFYNGTTLLATAPVASGIASNNATLTAAGTENLSAKYSGDTNFASSSGTLPVNVIAPVASATTLSVSSNSVTKGTIVTLTASVVSGGKPVTQGMVTFCNAKASFCEDTAVLASAHLTSSGTAPVKLALPAGANSILASFGGTAEAIASKSSAQTVTVTGTLASATALTVTGSAGSYSFQANVTGSWPPPQGQVSFIDTSSNNLVLGTAPLTLGSPQFTQSANLPTGVVPYAVAVADFNGDGKPDVAVAGYDSNTLTVLLGNGNGTFTAVASPIANTAAFSDPYAMVAADFNGDGIPDLAVINIGSNSVTILLGNGNGTFTQKSVASTGSEPYGITAGDFNGDGKLDLAVTSNYSNIATILLGNGDGTFSPEAESPSTGDSPAGIVTADFNGDGMLDLAVANAGSNSVTILRGNGDGTFTPAPVSPSTGTNPYAIAVGDFNNDGKPDLALANYGGSSVTVLLNAGAYNFTPVTSSPQTGVKPAQIATADFNGDGNTDLVVTDWGGPGLTLLLGNGDGKFNAQSIPVTSVNQPDGLAVGDFNANGSPDVALTGLLSSNLVVLLNSAVSTTGTQNIGVPGGGTHEIEATYTAVAPYVSSTSSAVAVVATPIATNIALTESPSIVPAGTAVTVTANVSPISADNYTLSGTVSLYDGTTLLATNTPSSGLTTFTVTFTTVGTHSLTAKYSGSTNFAASNSSPLAVYVISATTSTTKLSISTTSVASGTPVALTATVTSGGKPVTPGIVTFCNASATICENSAVLGTANLTSSGTASLKLTLGIGTYSIKAVFSGTQIEQSSSSTAQTLAVTGLHATTTTLTDSVVSGTYTLTTNVSGAGTQTPSGSVSFVNTTSNTTVGSAVLGTGTSALSFTAATALTAGSEPQAVGVGDLNRDGHPDLAVVNEGSGTVTVLLGNGNGTFTTKPTISVGGDPIAIAVGDFNGDGIPDLAVANFVSNSVSIFLGNGDGTFTAKPALMTGAGPIGVAIADFNLDGKLDLAVTNFTSGNVNIFLGNGDGTFAAGATLGGFSEPRSVAVGDFNDDGRSDLAISNYFGKSVTILLGDGNGSFVQSASIPAGNFPWPVVVGDFNGDGKLDVAVANSADSTLTVALGNGNGTFGSPTTIPLSSGSEPDGLVAADFNQDGKLDLVVSEEDSQRVAILLGNGNGTFTLQAAAIPTGSDPSLMAVGDFNGDGKLDLAVPNYGSNNVSVLLNSLRTSATATLSEVSISGDGDQSVVAKYAGSTVDASSTSNTLSLPPL